MASTRGDLTNAEDAAEEKAKLLERLEALKRRVLHHILEKCCRATTGLVFLLIAFLQ